MPALKGPHLLGTNTLFQRRPERPLLALAIHQLLHKKSRSRTRDPVNHEICMQRAKSDRLSLTGRDRCGLKTQRGQERPTASADQLASHMRNQ